MKHIFIEVTKKYRNGETKKILPIAIGEDYSLTDKETECQTAAEFWCGLDSSGHNNGYTFEWVELPFDRKHYTDYIKNKEAGIKRKQDHVNDMKLELMIRSSLNTYKLVGIHVDTNQYSTPITNTNVENVLMKLVSIYGDSIKHLIVDGKFLKFPTGVSDCQTLLNFIK